MNIGNKAGTGSCIIGALLAAIVAYFFFRLAHPAVPVYDMLQCDVQSNEYINISDFALEVLDADVKVKRQMGDFSQSRMVRLLWRCEVKNISTITVRYELRTEFLDKDAVVLATSTVDSNDRMGDLLPGQTHAVHNEIIMEYSNAKIIASSRVIPKILKTIDQIEQEQRKVAAKPERQAEMQGQLEATSNAWKKIQRGMPKAEVEKLLGKPVSVTTYGNWNKYWHYNEVKEGFKTPQVEFSSNGKVKSWIAP